MNCGIEAIDGMCTLRFVTIHHMAAECFGLVFEMHF